MKVMNFVVASLLVTVATNFSPAEAKQKITKDATQEDKTKALGVVQRMFRAFGNGDIEGMKKTVSSNTVWSYSGPKSIPYTGTYKGPEGVGQFVINIVSNVEILDFKTFEFISEGNNVVVTGYEKQKIKKNGQILEQKWVQVYKVENGLITSMDEYADTAKASELFSK